MGCRAPEVLMEGPAGTGKSRAVLQKVHYAALKYPGMRALIVRKTRASMTESVLVTFEAKVATGGDPDTGNQQRRIRHSYDYANGSSVVVGGMDNPDRIMSTEYDVIAAFEATELTEDDWEKLTTRLRNGVMPYQQAIADCNPGPPTHWLNQRASRMQMTRLLSRHEDNPLLFDTKAGGWTPSGAVYLSKLESLTGPRKLRLRDGKWAAAEGVVYEGYDPAVHLIDRFPIPPNWRRIRVIDFGYTNPFVCQWWALDEDGRMYLYREIYRTRRLVEDHARQILALSAGERYTATVADHDAEDRATAERHGIATLPATKAVSPGIQAVANRLTKAGDKRPRLFILRDSLVEADSALVEAKKPTCTEQEFDGYVWPKGQDGKPMKEEPVKENDHGMDAMRYAVAHVDGVCQTPLGVRVIGAGTGARERAEVWRSI